MTTVDEGQNSRMAFFFARYDFVGLSVSLISPNNVYYVVGGGG